MTEAERPQGKPRFGIGSLVNHQFLGVGRILGYAKSGYTLLLKGGEVTEVSFDFEGMDPVATAGDPELDRVKAAVQAVLGDLGWLDCDLELGKRWSGGTLRLIPGKEDAQSRDIPIEVFFRKIIGVREKLRVLEQKINNHPSLASEDKLELQGYLTRCYGSLTTFNALFAGKGGQFHGQGTKGEEE